MTVDTLQAQCNFNLPGYFIKNTKRTRMGYVGRVACMKSLRSTDGFSLKISWEQIPQETYANI